ncbi:MAG: SIMPL domain-containing protein [Crocinitomix sp.]|nr:SIMPL domain-containing protein [Crocinitomix sp.]
MINRILTTLFFAISIASFGQTDKYIEVVVSETVELKAQSAILKITKGSVEDVYDDYSNEYYSDEYYYEDQEYYRMLEESPKKVTEEMHQAFQERQNQREIRDQELIAAQAERINQADNALKNFAEKLTSQNIEFTLETDKKQNILTWYANEGEGDDELEEVMYVTVNNVEQYNEIIALSEDFTVIIQNHEIIYEKIDDKRQEIIETISKNAKSEAEMIAKSLNKKLGSVLTVSNSLPVNSTLNFEEYFDVLQKLYVSDDKSLSSPFSAVKKTTVGYVYRFVILD